MKVERPEYLVETTTATVGLDAGGLIVVRLFSGLELEIDARKTGLIQAAPEYAEFKKTVAEQRRAIQDAWDLKI
ncbi:MAG: hypothetical protein ABSG73_13310 [Candidatus Aminicenantales bacterium]